MIDSYIFKVPVNNWSIYGTSKKWEQGHTFVVSEKCNPNFVDPAGVDCEKYAKNKWCGDRVELLIHHGVLNTNGILETIRQCPQCGCGEDGAANLNELYTKEKFGKK